ncbi:MAG: exported dipeptidyl peptidase, partial [bacterium]|nr:exported dipeptidyl peptidase [bacterium]
ALAGCAHAPPPAAWQAATAIADSAPCIASGDETKFADVERGAIADELTKSGLAAQAAALSPSLAEIVPPERIESLRRAADEGRCRRIHYRVDGLRIVGFVLEPTGARPRSLPAILYARGGHSDLGKIDFLQLALLQTLADAGFVVATTQYRGVDGGDGADQLGGDEVHDLEALLPLVRALPAHDGARVYLYGHSRGGMEAYEALRDGLPVRAAAVSGALADLGHAIKGHPELGQVAAALIPDWSGKRQETIDHRSALRWADRIGVPLLLVHAREDWRVPLIESQAMDATLTRLGREHELLVVDGDAHPIYLHRQALVDAIVRWFRAH